MKNRVTASLFTAAFLATSILSGCNLPSVRFDPPFGSSNWVEFQDSIVVGPPTPALAVNFVNLKDKAISVRFEIDEIEGGDDCANSVGLAPLEKRAYACRQKSVVAGKRYRVTARVYTDLGETKLVERIQRIVEIHTGADGGLILVGRPLK